MANEIKINVSLNLVNGSHKEQFRPTQIQIDQNAVGSASGVAVVGTSEENLDVGDVSTEGMIVMQNLDSTNFITWGQDNSSTMQPIGKLNAGEVALFRMKDGETLRWQADTADVKVYWLLLED